MNTNTGEIRMLEALTEKERKSGEWVPVSDELAAAALELDVEDRTKALAKDVERVKRQLEGLRKEGRR